MPLGSFANTILKHLDRATIDRLRLRPIQLPLHQALESPGVATERAYFVEAGIATMLTMFEDGCQVQTSMFGYEPVVGIAGLMGAKQSLNNVFMQLEGYGYAAPIAAARAEFARGEAFQRLALCYVQTQLTLSTQTAACNAKHTYEQRLARWLLICCDRAQQRRITMAQKFVAQALGSSRSTVSIAAGHLKSKGFIDYNRGSIHVLDMQGLEAEACECYRVVRNHLEGLSSFDAALQT